MSVKLKRKSIVRLFEALGFKTASKWDNARLKKMVAKLPELEIDNAKLEDKLQNRLKSLLDMVEAKDAYEITSEDETVPQETAEETKTETAEETKEEAAADDDDEDDVPAEKTEKKEKAAKAEKPKKEKAPKAAKPQSKKRIDCICEAIKAIPKSGLTLNEVAEKANAEFIQNGGEDNVTQTLHHLRVICPVLATFKVVEKKEDKLFLC